MVGASAFEKQNEVTETQNNSYTEKVDQSMQFKSSSKEDQLMSENELNHESTERLDDRFLFMNMIGNLSE